MVEFQFDRGADLTQRVPMRLVIAGENVFGFWKDAEPPGPLLELWEWATFNYAEARQVERRGVGAVFIGEYGGVLLMRLNHRRVTLHSTIHKRDDSTTYVTDYDALLRAWRNLALFVHNRLRDQDLWWSGHRSPRWDLIDHDPEWEAESWQSDLREHQHCLEHITAEEHGPWLPDGREASP